MKKLLAATLLATASLGASASVITDVVDPTPNIAVNTATNFSFSHNILDQGFIPGFDTIVSALLTVTLTDPNNGQEKLYFVIGSGLQQVFTKMGNNNVNNGIGNSSFDVGLINHALADLADGMLAVTVGASVGEYAFAKSELTVTYTPGVVTPPPTPVPEPLSVALMGMGLLALRYGRRRR